MLDTTIRPLEASEVAQLADFLYLAIHQPDPDNLIPRSVLIVPEVAAYIEAWGKPDDVCLVAVKEQRLIGAVWTRIIVGAVRGNGHIDALTPEFSVSVLPVCRGEESVGSSCDKCSSCSENVGAHGHHSRCRNQTPHSGCMSDSASKRLLITMRRSSWSTTS